MGLTTFKPNESVTKQINNTLRVLSANNAFAQYKDSKSKSPKILETDSSNISIKSTNESAHPHDSSSSQPSYEENSCIKIIYESELNEKDSIERFRIQKGTDSKY